jgi:menaquinone-dependent protoporphyrinogen oxidase
MKTLIIYATVHGCTEKCAKALAEKLKGETHLCRIGQCAIPNLSTYDTIIIGASIHAGKIQPKMQRFMADRGLELMTKRLGLYLCCMYEDIEATNQFKNAFPEALRTFAYAQAIFGGEFDFAKMNIIERVLVRKIAKVKKSVSHIKMEEIERFAHELNRTAS